jgi:hypothetical protein
MVANIVEQGFVSASYHDHSKLEDEGGDQSFTSGYEGSLKTSDYFAEFGHQCHFFSTTGVEDSLEFPDGHGQAHDGPDEPKYWYGPHQATNHGVGAFHSRFVGICRRGKHLVDIGDSANIPDVPKNPVHAIGENKLLRLVDLLCNSSQHAVYISAVDAKVRILGK